MCVSRKQLHSEYDMLDANKYIRKSELLLVNRSCMVNQVYYQLVQAQPCVLSERVKDASGSATAGRFLA
jgi:hypothetical protein